jgi:hypothetical protein
MVFTLQIKSKASSFTNQVLIKLFLVAQPNKNIAGRLCKSAGGFRFHSSTFRVTMYSLGKVKSTAIHKRVWGARC